MASLILSLVVGTWALAQEPTEPQEPANPAETATEEAPKTEPQAEPQTEARAEEPRIEFAIPLPEDQGGGLVTGSATSFDAVEERYAELTGRVELFYQDLIFRADRVRVDQEAGVLDAEGNVELERGDEKLTAATATYDLNAKTGSFTDAEVRASPDYFFTGKEVAKVEEDVYTVVDGTFTSCTEDPVPDWSFHVARARVRLDGYAKAKNAAFRIKKTPVLFTPYILWPVKDDRTSGFLLPQPGYSSRRGASLSMAYYQVLGRSYDTTIELDLWSEGFVAVGNEFRYNPSENTEGVFVGYAVNGDGFEDAGFVDPNADEVRWKVRWNHETRNLPGGMRGVINIQDYSDFEFFRDFERDFDDNTLRSIDSRGFATGSWGPHFLNVLANRRETFISSGNTVTLTKLPEIEYQLRATRLGNTPIYVELDSSLDYLDLDRSDSLQSEYFRADLFPQLTVPLRTVPWLSTSFTVGQRMTYWGDRLRTQAELDSREPGDTSAFAGDELDRSVPFASAEIVGPSLSRIFERKDGSKLKHVVEPRWTYTFLDEFEEEEQIPLFDEVDRLRSNNAGRFALINRFLAKPPGDEGSAREVLLLELAQEFSFDEDQPLQQGLLDLGTDEMPMQEFVTRSAGPLTGLVRYNPRPGVSLKADASYNTLFDEIERTSLSSTWSLGSGNRLDLTWFTRNRPDTGESTQNQVRFGGAVNLLPGRLSLRGQINYDFELGELQQQRYIFDWTGECCGISVEVRDFQTGEIRDTDYRIAVTLKNVGTFLDLTGGFSNRP